MIKYSNVDYVRDGDDYEDANVFIVQDSGEEWKRQVTKYLETGKVGCDDFSYANSRYDQWVELSRDAVVPAEVLAEFEKHITDIYTHFGVSPLRYWAEKYSAEGVTPTVTPNAV